MKTFLLVSMLLGLLGCPKKDTWGDGERNTAGSSDTSKTTTTFLTREEKTKVKNYDNAEDREEDVNKSNKSQTKPTVQEALAAELAQRKLEEKERSKGTTDDDSAEEVAAAEEPKAFAYGIRISASNGDYAAHLAVAEAFSRKASPPGLFRIGTLMDGRNAAYFFYDADPRGYVSPEEASKAAKKFQLSYSRKVFATELPISWSKAYDPVRKTEVTLW